ncbi:MAG: class I SAM-dependent methyltransferase [Candidatus Bilamarchaeaceae archaeon]
MDRYCQKIKDYWMNKNPKNYWGDDLDVRFLLIKKLSNLRNKRVLDIGCNIGVILRFIDNSNKKYGIDISPELITMAKKEIPGGVFRVADAKKLPYKTNSFDVVLLVNMIEGIPINECNARIAEAVRVLKKGGTLYLTTPNRLHIYYFFNNTFFPWELRALILKHGLEVEEFITYNPLILPSAWVAWIPYINQILDLLTNIPFTNMFGRGIYVKMKKL